MERRHDYYVQNFICMDWIEKGKSEEQNMYKKSKQ